MRILISTPPSQRPRLYVVHHDDALIFVHATDERISRDELDLLRAVWPGIWVGAHFAPLALDVLFYAPRGRSGCLYVGKTSRPTLRRFLIGARQRPLAAVADALDPDHAQIITLQPLQKGVI